MRPLQWNISQAVFVTEIDDEHKEIFASVSNLLAALSSPDQLAAPIPATRRLILGMEEHFAHEERLMRAARYDSFRWHKQKHDGALRHAQKYVNRIVQGDLKAGPALVAYLRSWLKNHTRVADMMLGAFLRNHERSLWKMTFRAGTKPMNACTWFDAQGHRFDPSSRNSGY